MKTLRKIWWWMWHWREWWRWRRINQEIEVDFQRAIRGEFKMPLLARITKHHEVTPHFLLGTSLYWSSPDTYRCCRCGTTFQAETDHEAIRKAWCPCQLPLITKLKIEVKPHNFAPGTGIKAKIE
jgi:DNA-directed RNA polymerase subunit RPC12/RpoP